AGRAVAELSRRTVATSRAAMAVVLAVGTVGFVWLTAAGWGGVAPLLAHPARAVTVAVCFVLAVVALASGANLSAGRREDVESRRILAPVALGSALLAWLPAYMDRRDVWVLDGDAVRWLGVALFIVGGVLRVWPTFILGRRFSGLVAIQEGHTLV